ncbi:MAG TPA: A/G-specific adenine glycosylase [Burkholderiales bacterium]|jgi:A/G-specific adenine glycosylase
MPAKGEDSFAQRVIGWQQTHGRHDLPWQNTRDPYGIWVSEIMLQQTQVSAVVGYYQRFMERFPDVASLATAPNDEVMRHWAGLGYYSRARNLHRAAQLVMDRHGGAFPRGQEEIEALPGIGRSTAAAIRAFAFGARAAILDGNVKRVFARHAGIAGYPGLPKIEKQMWQLADERLPQGGLEPYIQGLMDLGATLCTRGRPRCKDCPVATDCVARRENRTAELPTRKPKKELPQRETMMLVLMRAGSVLLEKRPPTGIWGGLWSLPQAEDDSAARKLAQAFGADWKSRESLNVIEHGFTHYHLSIKPLLLTAKVSLATEEPGHVWLPLAEAKDAALPSPVKKLLTSLAAGTPLFD